MVRVYKTGDTIRLKIENCYDIRQLYAAADEQAKAEGWKNYTIVGKVGAGKVLTIKKTK